MQVSGGSQSFNAVNTLRLQGRCVRMITIPSPGDLQSHADHRIGRSTTQVSWVTQESIS